MSEDKPHGTECFTCSRMAALKVKAGVLQQLIAGVLPAPSSQGQSEADLTPRQLEATRWNVAIGACLRQEMAPHPRCAGCGILMGPGHLEAGIDSMCGTCRYRRTVNNVGEDLGASRPVIGRRGWLSDYAVER